MIEVVNRQRKLRIDPQRWQAFSEKAVAAIVKKPCDATIAFVSDRQIQDLNKRFRGIDKATDVLSFPAGEEVGATSVNLGDIAISLERAAIQAKENRLTRDQEIAQLILHGLLHLCGYDHETDTGQMNRLELRLRKQLGI
ncbi:MAG TPA: rRNA maturation RNase YbeY [Pyrinomonadaceae bacterium]|nr:rRNA maturation RNase YbeY [Pyrinomonadaceae bacterium]